MKEAEEKDARDKVNSTLVAEGDQLKESWETLKPPNPLNPETP